MRPADTDQAQPWHDASFRDARDGERLHRDKARWRELAVLCALEGGRTQSGLAGESREDESPERIRHSGRPHCPKENRWLTPRLRSGTRGGVNSCGVQPLARLNDEYSPATFQNVRAGSSADSVNRPSACQPVPRSAPSVASIERALSDTCGAATWNSLMRRHFWQPAVHPIIRRPTGCSLALSQQFRSFVFRGMAPRAGFEPATLRLTG